MAATHTRVGPQSSLARQAEEEARLKENGLQGVCGHPADGVFDHATGKGWVAVRKGEYDDAINIKVASSV